VKHLRQSRLLPLLAVLFSSIPSVIGQTADQAWLKYELKERVRSFFPIAVRALGNDPVELAAMAELNRNLGSLAGQDASKVTARVKETLSGETVLGTVEEIQKSFPNAPIPQHLGPKDYWI